ncbi:Molybdenum-pterin-binding protein MopA [Hydrogenovibrio crunogenus]|uniref:Molybdenum-pterin-binding protein MopA n=1 Tax=Hydrogenovibrio crunogenus TaxID=39765 RepID=A0A4P7NXH0_9GAMM|nr:winged helix-turn-helix domain-containing protein [Hydrogenovibrio crunogenus]QBZ82443.1 Molybdenum-pterin-binding protein MopA [Hydrogenovibrio crunogenus]RUM92745.1 MAG: ModE family transcriptional regulator [Thiomicrospira sp.]
MSSSDKSTQPKLPGEGYAQNIRARFWLTGKSGAYAGIGRITLLEKIHERGSINQAAKEMKMSYKKAWKLIDEMNQMFDEPLVLKEHGGKSGGGTQLTSKGQSVVEEFRQLEKKLVAFLQEESKKLNF